MRTLIGIICAAWMPAAGAHVISLDTVGESFTVDWLLEAGALDGNGESTNITGYDIKAQGIFTLTAFNAVGNYIDLNISLANTTAANTVKIGLWKMGFGTDPNVTGVQFFDADDKGIVSASKGTFPAFPDAAQIDVTSVTGTGAPRTIQSGGVDVFDLRLTFADLTELTEITLNPFNVFFQSDKGSYHFASIPPPPPPPPPEEPVPEPSVLLLLGMGMLLLASVNSGVLARKRIR